MANEGVPVDEILADYPSVSKADVAFAQLFAEMKPNPGRPRKRLRIKGI